MEEREFVTDWWISSASKPGDAVIDAAVEQSCIYLC
jgi:hypothetical protein